MSKIPILFELMKNNKVTQQQLSEAVKVSQGNISDWKSGRSSPSIEVLPKIAEYFNVSVDYLLGLDDEPNKTLKDIVLNSDAHYENCYVACLDILGFSEYTKNYSFDDIWDIFEAYFYVKGNVPITPQGTAFSVEEMAKLKFNLISDTIVISIPKIENRSLEMLVFAVDIIVSNVMLNSYLQVRGAISDGNFYSNDTYNCFWGKALVNAHELENYKAVYPRIIIPPAIFKEYEDTVTGEDKKNINYLVKLDPVISDSFYIVDYVRYILDRLVVKDKNEAKAQNAWNNLIDDYEKKLNSEKNLHILNKYIYFAKYYNEALINPSELLYYKSRQIKCKYDNFIEEQPVQVDFSEDIQELIDLYNDLPTNKKERVKGYIDGILS